MASRIDADLAVIGAGPAGSATALFAARKGQRVLLLDKASFPRDKACGEGLMPSGRPVLRALGLEDLVVRSGAPPLQGIQFGLAGGTAAVVPFPDHGGERQGLGIRRLDFDEKLVEAVQREPAIRFVERVRATELRRNGDRRLIVSDRGEYAVTRVVVADGLRSSIRHTLGWTVGPRPPHRYGIVGHWEVEGPVDPWVRITFTDGLEVYDGPVAGNQRMVGLLCYRARMHAFGGQLESGYRDTVRRLRPALAAANPVGRIRATGPFWYRAKTVADGGIFLVGDAAGFTDPITGEGVAAGLRQAQALVAAFDCANPEASYRLAHRRLTADPRRVASLLLRLSRTPGLVGRGVRSQRAAPQMLPKLLGVGFGYWGFSRITPREWVRIFTGR